MPSAERRDRPATRRLSPRRCSIPTGPFRTWSPDRAARRRRGATASIATTSPSASSTRSPRSIPATQRITGPDFFRAMARFHARATPPSSPLLFEYGRDFPDFIAGYEHARPMPWLADVARIERAWLDAYHAADAEPLAPQLLASIAPERLAETVLIPHPATRIVRSPYPAVSIFAANRGDGPVGPHHGDRAGGRADHPTGARGHRPESSTRRCGLPDASCRGRASRARPPRRRSPSSPAFDLGANIAGMLEAGAFTAIDQGAR